MAFKPGWVKDKDGFWLADSGDGGKLSDVADIVGTEGEIYHVQNVGRILAHCAEMQNGRGWSKDRTMKRLASIPLLVLLNHPVLDTLQTNNEVMTYMMKYLPEYVTCHDTKGRATAQVVIK